LPAAQSDRPIVTSPAVTRENCACDAIVLDADDGYVIQRIGFAYHLCVVPLCRGQQYRRKFGQFRAIRQKPDTRDAIASRALAGTMPTKLGSGRHANR
jgi:hypothetical protein